MIYILAIFAYAAVVGAGIRFFQTVRTWDDEARFLMQREVARRKPASTPSVTRRRNMPASRRAILQG